MRKRTIWATLTALTLSCGYYLFAPDDFRPISMKSEFEQYCLQCEEVLKDRLRSPSSYVRIECSGPYTEPANMEEYLRHDGTKNTANIDSWTQRNIENGELQITTAYLKYEAANGFGASIAGLEACTVDHREGQSFVSDYSIMGPNVGGYSKAGWAIHQLTGN